MKQFNNVATQLSRSTKIEDKKWQTKYNLTDSPPLIRSLRDVEQYGHKNKAALHLPDNRCAWWNERGSIFVCWLDFFLL